MALQTINGGIWVPAPIGGLGASAPAFAALLIDAAAEKAAFIIEIPKTGTLDQFEFRLNAVTQAPVNGLRCSFQDIGITTGDPDGTADQYRVVTAGLTANTWVAPGLITSDGTDGGTKRSVTRGERIACVIEYASFSASDSLEVSLISDSSSTVSTMCPNVSYPDLYTTVWTKRVGFPVVALKYNDGTYEYLGEHVIPASASNSITFASNSDPNEYGLYFQVPFPCNLRGCWFRADLDGDADVVLYDSDGTTELASFTLDKDIRLATSGANGMILFSADVALTKATNYRLVLQPTTTTAIILFYFEVAAAAIMDGFNGGQEFYLTARAAADTWAETTTKRPLMGLLISACDDAVGGGGRPEIRGPNL